jgi:hypothetical protein
MLAEQINVIGTHNVVGRFQAQTPTGDLSYVELS